MKQEYASPGLHVTYADEQNAAGRGVASPYKHGCNCGERTTYQAGKHADAGMVQGLRRSSVEPKSSEPLLARSDTNQGLHRAAVGPKSSEPLLALSRGRDLLGAGAEPRADDPRNATARKRPSEALLTEAHILEASAHTSAVAPSSPGTSRPLEAGVEVRTVSSGKRQSSTARKPKHR